MAPPHRRTRVRLGAGAEFDLIRALIAEEVELPASVRVGPGDDCAVLEAGGASWAVTVDLSVEGIHFRREWLDLEEVGWRAGAAALSDLAAVAAEPAAVLLALALPPEDARSGGAAALERGVRAAAASVGAAIVGGDLSRSQGPLVIDVAALGRVATPVLRDGGCPGHELWITGRLGAAAAAVTAWERGKEPAPALRRSFARPEPRVREALWLAATGAVRAMIDLSDGLAGDAGHIGAASGCGVLLTGVHVPVAEGVRSVTGNAAAALQLVLSSGEDYELCLAAEPGALEAVLTDFEARFGLPLTCVGRLVEGEGVALEYERGGDARPLAGGYSHFAREER